VCHRQLLFFFHFLLPLFGLCFVFPQENKGHHTWFALLTFDMVKPKLPCAFARILGFLSPQSKQLFS